MPIRRCITLKLQKYLVTNSTVVMQKKIRKGSVTY